MAAFHVELVSPERVLLSGEATMVRARTTGGGDIAFLPGHAPFLGALETWTLEVTMDDGTVETAAVHGGFVSVAGDHVTILSDLAELESQIDAARAQRAQERAEEAVRRDGDDEATAALERATARLRATGQLTS